MHLCEHHETAWHAGSKERLGEVCALHHTVRHLQLLDCVCCESNACRTVLSTTAVLQHVASPALLDSCLETANTLSDREENEVTVK